MSQSKTNPGGAYLMLRYLSELSGMSMRKEIEVSHLNKLRRKTGSRLKNKTVLIYPACDIEVVINGERIPYMLPCECCGKYPTHYRYDTKYTDPPEKFIVIVDRNLEEFGIEIHSAGTYQNCLGGGWTEKVSLYRINDQYFYL